MIETQREVAHGYIDQSPRHARADAREWVQRARDWELADDPALQSTPEPRQLVTTSSPNGRPPSLDLLA